MDLRVEQGNVASDGHTLAKVCNASCRGWRGEDSCVDPFTKYNSRWAPRHNIHGAGTGAPARTSASKGNTMASSGEESKSSDATYSAHSSWSTSKVPTMHAAGNSPTPEWLLPREGGQLVSEGVVPCDCGLKSSTPPSRNQSWGEFLAAGVTGGVTKASFGVDNAVTGDTCEPPEAPVLADAGDWPVGNDKAAAIPKVPEAPILTSRRAV
mmetsp:Transcript_64994/g.127813  ORF Transcript_64994/g.127813 Transcript_64994/m.127813 type:complete len:210 (-) Transcript_64994:117-746(-)